MPDAKSVSVRTQQSAIDLLHPKVALLRHDVRRSLRDCIRLHAIIC